MKRFVQGSILTASFVALMSCASMAQESGPSCGPSEFMDAVGARESTNNYSAVNSGGFLGRYQMGHLALQEAGLAHAGSTSNSNIRWKDGWSAERFLNDPLAQDAAYRAYAAKNWGYLEHYGLSDYANSGLTANGQLITESSLLFASQFGVDRVKNYFEAGGTCVDGAKDGNGVCVAEYMALGSGYDISSIIGGAPGQGGGVCNAPPVQEAYKGDTTSKTCPPTVQMLQAIDCSAYPANMQGFCSKYKPLQMTMGECQAAEKWAENYPPSGPHLEGCKEQTFKYGTSSWAYVRACANVEPPMGPIGAENGEQKIIGAADDPACYDRLKGMGVKFFPLGKMDISTGGRSCIIPNAVQYQGTAVPMDRSVTLNCALVEQIERFGPIARGLGVSEYKVLGTLSCRGINNTSGTNQSKTSLHGTGNAIDINGFGTSLGVTKTNEYFTNPAAKVWLTSLRDAGCSVFDGTLAYNFYKQQWTHVHWQATETTRCDPPG